MPIGASVVVRPREFDDRWPPFALVVGTGVDPVTSRFSGARSAD
jgi:hypothetical protein